MKTRNIIIDGIDFSFVWCPPGIFTMGEADKPENEWTCLFRQVELTQGFWIQTTLVTQRMYAAFRKNSSYHSREYFLKYGPREGFDPELANQTDSLPVEKVSWKNAMSYCKLLTKKAQSQLDNEMLTLPTEAQWEYACRAGTTTLCYWGDSLATTEQAKFNTLKWNASRYYHTVPVASYPPNPWGIYDMLGNVWEWCLDGELQWDTSPVKDPYGTDIKEGEKALRGGAYNSPGFACVPGGHIFYEPTRRDFDFGFRMAIVSK